MIADPSIYKNIPNELKNKTVTQVILTFFKPPVGALIAATVSTFGIYLFASFLYVSHA
jgi:chitin synthase